MKILHLTDLHIGAEQTPDMGRRIDHLIRKLIADRHMVPHLRDIEPIHLPVVITGDLVDRGIEPGIFDLTREIFINPLQNAGYPLFIVPGNHDYGTGSAANRTTETDFHLKFHQEVFASEPNTYPVLRWVGNVAMIGLNSMAEEVYDDADGDARGRLGVAQLNSLRAILLRNDVINAAKRVVYLHHHPFFKGISRHWMALDDTEELQEILLNEHINLLLFGHKHEGKAWHGKNDTAIKAYDGGTSTGHKKKLSPHRLIDLDTNNPADDIDLNLMGDYEGDLEE